MSQGVWSCWPYARDQDEALNSMSGSSASQSTDVKNGDYRWLTVQHPDQPSFQLGLFAPQAPILDAATAQTMREACRRARCRRWC